MERENTPVSEEMALKEIDKILLKSMEEFERACSRHIPFVRSAAGYIKYISERCIVTYFSWGLINEGFTVFNEQMVKCGEKAQRTQRFDLLARRFAPEGGCVQIKAEAKGNLDGGYGEIYEDIKRMEDFTVERLDITLSNPERNWEDSRFPYRFNIILTQNWGLMELSRWWDSNEEGTPRNERGSGVRRSPKWGELKQKLLKAKKRGVIPILKSAPDCNYSIDVLYAIFNDTSVEHKEEVWKEVLRNAEKARKAANQ